MKTNLLRTNRWYTIAWRLVIMTMLILPINVFAGSSGGGGGLNCGMNGSYTMPNNSTACDPTTTNCFGGPGYYLGSDVDCDGCEDVNYSVENNTFFTFTGPAGSGCVDYDFIFTPTNDLNLQATIFPPVTGSTPCGCTGYDGNNSVEKWRWSERKWKLFHLDGYNL